jgi:hypothetical protein|eukprot:COSAG06_NODE_2458_length_6841_cov_31.691041_2_plen_118_part_00
MRSADSGEQDDNDDGESSSTEPPAAAAAGRAADGDDAADIGGVGGDSSSGGGGGFGLGVAVELKGLVKAAQHNGKQGFVRRLDDRDGAMYRGRLVVELQGDGALLSVKPDNLRLSKL